MQNKSNILTPLTIGYFTVAFVEILAEYFASRQLICILKPILPLILILLYYIESEKKDGRVEDFLFSLTCREPSIRCNIPSQKTAEFDGSKGISDDFRVESSIRRGEDS